MADGSQYVPFALPSCSSGKGIGVGAGKLSRGTVLRSAC